MAILMTHSDCMISVPPIRYFVTASPIGSIIQPMETTWSLPDGATVVIHDRKDQEIDRLKKTIAELSKRPTLEAWSALCQENAALRKRLEPPSIPVENKAEFPVNALRQPTQGFHKVPGTGL